ncbi:MAG: CvpA family protein [Balneolaceae bacterium]|nr:MAG: CvpA family protein [Balneolaceae bacterium]
MNLFDIIIVMPVAFFAWLGFRNGLVRELLGIVGVVLALFIAFQYAGPATNWFNTETVENSQYLPYFTFIIIFIVILILIRLTIFFMEEFLSVLMLSVPNRILGSIFGILKASLFISIALIIFDSVEVPEKETRDTSLTYYTLIEVAPKAYDLAAFFYPGAESYYDDIHTRFEEFKAGTRNF